jgi:hypothetical protein
LGLSFTASPSSFAAVVLTIRSTYLGIEAGYRNEAALGGSTLVIGTLVMTTFDRREEAFERKFALDEEQKFKAEARRNKLLGLWVADQLGITGEAANAYAKEVVAADFEEAGDGAVRKVSGDLAARDVAITEPQIRAKLDEFLALAILQVKAGT